jgi:succinate-acetate transporter protein
MARKRKDTTMTRRRKDTTMTRRRKDTTMTRRRKGFWLLLWHLQTFLMYRKILKSCSYFSVIFYSTVNAMHTLITRITL